MDFVGGSWVGNFECSVCSRKRLTGESFSGTQLRKLQERILREDELKCKACVAAAEAALRERAYEARKGSVAVADDPPLLCSVCKQERPPASFSNTQARKPRDARKCHECSAAAEAREAVQLTAARRAKLENARAAAAAAESRSTAKASAAERLLTAASECAAEAELVTGLKPRVGAGKRGRGRGRGRGTWRGRGRGK